MNNIDAHPGETIYNLAQRAILTLQWNGMERCTITHNETTVIVRKNSCAEDVVEKWQMLRELKGWR